MTQGGCKIRTMKEIYTFGIKSPIVIIDEFDELIAEYSY